MIKRLKKVFRSRLADTIFWGLILLYSTYLLSPDLSELFQEGNLSPLKEYTFYVILIIFFVAVYFFLITYIHNYGWKYKGDKAYEGGEFNLAIKYFTILINIFRWDGSYLVDRGNCYYKMSKWQMAINDYTKALKLEPDAAYIYKNRAYAYKMLGFRKHSATDYTKVKELEKIKN